jgi:16S rRNA (cytosine967-C5)-methyltransferase
LTARAAQRGSAPDTEQGAVTTARWAALRVLRGLRAGELLDSAFAAAQEQVPHRERRWSQELVYGTVRLRGRIDYSLDRQIRRGLDSLHPDIIDVLRLGAYQLLQMNSVPAYAAVSQAVEMAKVLAPNVSGLVNGVLQSIRRSQDALEFPPSEDLIAHLSTWGSHPRWLIERWLRSRGARDTAALVEANNLRPELYIRPIGTTRADALRMLTAASVPAEIVERASESIRIAAAGDVLEALNAVPCVVQDPAAALVVRYADIPAGATVADPCAAPGGKAMELAERARLVLASDVSWSRLQRVRENTRRLSHLPLALLVADARTLPLREVDAVLIDAPCTGTGTFRRHPDGKWRLRPGDVDTLATLQGEILRAAARSVKAGGLLVYSTCSLEPEENAQQVEAFLEDHSEYRLEPPPSNVVDPSFIDASGTLNVMPQHSGFDGAFAARLRRCA